ncbi:MAG: hypothetical protein ACRC5M_02435 [Anaeroplasmataceae bacterium]
MFDYYYYITIKPLMISVFNNSRNYFPKIDLLWFIDYFMKSYIIDELDKDNTRYLNYQSPKIFYLIGDEFEEKGIDYAKSDKTIDNEYGDSLRWCAMQYISLIRVSGLKLETVYSKINISEMLDNFITGHERSFTNCSEFLIDKYKLRYIVAQNKVSGRKALLEKNITKSLRDVNTVKCVKINSFNRFLQPSSATKDEEDDSNYENKKRSVEN